MKYEYFREPCLSQRDDWYPDPKCKSVQKCKVWQQNWPNPCDRVVQMYSPEDNQCGSHLCPRCVWEGRCLVAPSSPEPGSLTQTQTAGGRIASFCWDVLPLVGQGVSTSTSTSTYYPSWSRHITRSSSFDVKLTEMYCLGKNLLDVKCQETWQSWEPSEAAEEKCFHYGILPHFTTQLALAHWGNIQSLEFWAPVSNVLLLLIFISTFNSYIFNCISRQTCLNTRMDGWILRKPPTYQIYFSKSSPTVG